MTEQTKRLMNEFASALEAAGALARQIAECEPAKCEIKLDAEAFYQAARSDYDTRRPVP